MRIAFIGPFPASRVLGADAVKPKYASEHPAPWMSALSSGLIAQGDVEVAVFVHSRAVRQTHTVEAGALTYCFIPKREPIRSDPFHGFLPARLALTRPVKSFNPDIVVGFGTESGCGYVATHLPFPSVLFIQGIQEHHVPYYDSSALTKRMRLHLERKTVQRANGIVAETLFARDWALSVDGDAKVAVIPHGSTADFFDVKPNYSSGRLLCIGLLNKRKGSDTVLKAFIEAGCGDSSLVFIGDGPLRGWLEDTARAGGVADRVAFIPHCGHSRILKEMHDARALVIGSRMDTSPNVVTEAHAARLAVIGTSAGGISDMIVDAEDGYIVETDNPQAMAIRMKELLLSPSLAEDMGGAGRTKVAHLNDPVRVATEHRNFYTDVLRRIR